MTRKTPLPTDLEAKAMVEPSLDHNTAENPDADAARRDETLRRMLTKPKLKEEACQNQPRPSQSN